MEKGSITLIINGQEVVSKAQMADVQRQTSTVTVLGIESKATAAMPIAPEPEIDYNVEYDGQTYTRVMSGDYYAENVLHSDDIYWGYVEQSKQEVASDTLSWTEKANVLKASTDFYINWSYDDSYFVTEVLLENKTCLSYWTVSGEDVTYTEVYSLNGNPLTIVWLFVKDEDELAFDDYYTQTYPDAIGLGTSIYTHDPYENVDWGGHPRNIPNRQPTK